MALLGKISFRTKLALQASMAMLSLVLLGFAANTVLRAVSVGSPIYNSIALAYQLAGDCYDPPASLVAALPDALAAEDATTPADTERAVALLRKDHQDFKDAHAKYRKVLPNGPIRDAVVHDTYPSGERWFELAESEYIPSLLAGEHEKARQIRIRELNPIFQSHKAANDHLSDLTASWIPDQEHAANAIVASRRTLLAGFTLVMLALLGAGGWIIARGMLVPLRLTVTALQKVAQGDLTQNVETGTQDEMHLLANAVNETVMNLRLSIQSIAQGSIQLGAASEEISATAANTSDRTRNQAVETKQASSAIREVTASIAEVNQSAIAARERGEQADAAAERGQAVVADTVSVIQRIAEVTDHASSQIAELGKSSEQIGKIVGVIDEIAGQTNLLALNAAIEAARAGEQGKGFAVVAGEVRRLAERTTEATKEIAEMVRSIQSQTSNAVRSMEGGSNQVQAGLRSTALCGKALSEIVSLTREAVQMVAQIADNTARQSTSAAAITASVTQIAGFSDHAVVATDETVVVCRELSKLAAVLAQSVQRFKLTEDSTGSNFGGGAGSVKFAPASASWRQSLQSSRS